MKMIIDPITAEAEYYSKKLYLSYSALKLMIYSPKAYYERYVLQQKDDSYTDAMAEGQVIHCLLLENGKFDEKFVVSPANLPTGNNKDVVEKVYGWAKENDKLDLNLKSLDEVIIETLKSVDLHQSLKTDKQRVEKMLTEDNVGYFDYLRTKGDRMVIDQETLSKCKEYESVVRSNGKACKLLGLDSFDQDTSLKTYNEFLIQTDMDKYPFGLKGVLDNVTISEKERTVDINDLKTTSKTVAEFGESVEFYRYDIQAAIQKILAWRQFPQYANYKWNFTFHVIDKHQQLYLFKVSDLTMDKWLDNLTIVLKDAEYHYKNKRWGLPRRFDQGEVVL